MHPTATDYLARLPRGAGSYPTVLVKGTVIRSALEDPKFWPDREGLPHVVQALLDEPPTVGAWVPEVHFQALMATIYDAHFAHAGGLTAFEAWTFDRNRDIFRSPLYRILFILVSPERVLIGAPTRWGVFHRGSELEVVEVGKRRALIRLTYPAGLMLEPCAHSYGGAFRAALAAAGAARGTVRSDVESDTCTRYVVQWG